MKTRLIRTVLLFWVVACVSGCGGGGGGGGGPMPPSTSPVTFEYVASTQVDPGVDYASCSPTGVIFFTHLHFIWNQWDDRRVMTPMGADRFTYTAEVPTGANLEIALHDPNNCLLGDVYVAPATLYANGVLLQRVVNVLEGTGVAFRHESDGTIVP